MIDRPVLFKGTRSGLSIYISSHFNMLDIKQALLNKLVSGKPFFEGTRVNLTFIGKELNDYEKQEILELTGEYIQLGTVEFQCSDNSEQKPPKEDLFDSFEGIDEGMTRFVRGTVRSGQRIFYEGNVVIIGDVNPGGEVIAGGNIVVLGTLRGLAHAGATGNHKAVVASYSLQPTQLRIASKITRAPEGDSPKPQYPEVSYIGNDQLLIEPYLPGKGK